MSDQREILPSSIKPKHYDLSLFDLLFKEPFTYQGTVKISLSIKEPVQEVKINCRELKLLSADLDGQSVTEGPITYDLPSQTATIKFPKQVAVSEDAILEIRFEGIMNDSMEGFYRSRYKPAAPTAESMKLDDEHYAMYSTQFEAVDARRAFPCFDEPALKATFAFEIEVPEDVTALANMPEKSQRPGSAGRKVVSFETTPILSTYLVAWALGDFEYIEDFTQTKYNGKPIPVRIYTTRGLKEQGRFALEHANKTVDLFSKVFQIDYYLPKCDMIAVHDFAMGAMENSGLITYRTTAILFDEAKSDAKYRNRVAYVVAHELAHQWFGNLVTMSWWNELWLNEGFATWVGWYAINEFHPEWEVWSQFVVEAVQTASNLDSLRSSHPIDVPIMKAPEVDQVFDAISYLKGSSVIRMLAAHLGEKNFLQGVANYLKAHAYANGTTKNLWDALSEVSGQDVDAFMDPWIRKIGFPVVTVAEEPGQIGVSQKRFLQTGDVEAKDDQTIWWIPLGLKTGKTNSVEKQALTTKSETIRDVDESFYKINVDTTGFYRTNYPPDRLTALGKAHDQLTTNDNIGLIGDAAALAVSGEGKTAGLLSLVAEYKDETHFLIWQQVLNSLGNVRAVFGTNEAINAGLKKFTLELVAPAVEKIGWNFAPNEDFLTGQLRSLLITTAGGAGHQPTIEKAKEQFAAYIAGDKNAINASLRLPVFRLAVENGGQAEYEAVKKEYLSTTSIDGLEICLVAMGKVQSADLARDFLAFHLTNAVKVQDAHTGGISLAVNAKVRHVVWEYIKENWDGLFKKLGVSSVTIDRFVKNTLNKFSDRATAADIAAFFKDKDTSAFDKGLAQVQDAIGANAAYRERDEALISEWLSVHGYL